MNRLIAIFLSLAFQAQTATAKPVPNRPSPIPFPIGFRCEDISTCATIQGIKVDSKTATCWSESREFDCQHLVEQIGIDAIGKTVEVITQKTDTCHIEGGCGPRACITIGTFARESVSCL